LQVEPSPLWNVTSSRAFPRAFIIRPFGTKKIGETGPTIDFQRVEDELIRPAMARAEVLGATTEVYDRSGPIGRDMFQRLVTAQLVIADISIHNANVYYELGIRHALRDKFTYLIRSKVAGHDMPFDIRTERYLLYDVDDLAKQIDPLAAGLKATLRGAEHDSPVFSFVPELESQDPSRFIVTPEEFRLQLQRAEIKRRSGDIQFLAAEVSREDWGLQALTLAAQAQVRLKAWAAAAQLWEQVRAIRGGSLDADLQLGAVYQQLQNYAKAKLVLGRLRDNTALPLPTKARIHGLLGETSLRRWIGDWSASDPGREEAALKSPFLREAYGSFVAAFENDLNDIRYGIHALLLGTILRDLADRLPHVWAELDFDDEDPAAALRAIKEDVIALPRSIEFASRAAPQRERAQQLEPETTLWCKAELRLLTGASVGRIADAYRKVSNAANPPMVDFLRDRLQLLEALAILPNAARPALDALGPPAASPSSRSPHAVIVFLATRPELLTATEPSALGEQILTEVSGLGDPDELLAIAGASPAEIVFHEVCERLLIPTLVCVSHDTADFEQVNSATWGPTWAQQFSQLKGRLPVQTLQDGPGLPSWVSKTRVGLQRANTWLLYTALQYERPVVLILPSDLSAEAEASMSELLRQFGDRQIRTIRLATDHDERRD